MHKMLRVSASLRLAGVPALCALAVNAGAARGAGASPNHDCAKSLRCHTPAQASAGDGRPLCARYRCTTIVADAQAEILFVTENHGMRDKKIVGTFARWRQTGRVSLLFGREVYRYQKELREIYGEAVSREYRPGPSTLAGRYVAYVRLDCSEVHPCFHDSGVGPQSVIRVDVKTGRRVELSGKSNNVGLSSGITDLVLTPKGTAAWIEDDALDRVRMARMPPPRFYSATVLASSPMIEPHSLALSGSHLYWTEAGQPREARIE